MARCLVTGHKGYIGSRLFKKLKELGEEVTLENWLRLAYPGENKKLSDKLFYHISHFALFLCGINLISKQIL